MGNHTKEKITIKLKADNLYYLYYNDNFVLTKGHYKSILEAAADIIERIDKGEKVYYSNEEN